MNTAQRIGHLAGTVACAASDLRYVAAFAEGDLAAQILEIAEGLTAAYVEYHGGEYSLAASAGRLSARSGMTVSRIERLVQRGDVVRNVRRALAFAAEDIAAARESYLESMTTAA